jgi:glucose-1-phosphate thymidylyltransferase
MKTKGVRFAPGKVTEWLDCGNKDATVYTNQRVLEFKKDEKDLVSASMKNEGSEIIAPCFIGANVVLKNSKVGPHVSIGDNTIVSSSVIANSIIQANSKIQDSKFENSMVGNYTDITGADGDLSIGDYTVIKLN